MPLLIIVEAFYGYMRTNKLKFKIKDCLESLDFKFI